MAGALKPRVLARFLLSLSLSLSLSLLATYLFHYNNQFLQLISPLKNRFLDAVFCLASNNKITKFVLPIPMTARWIPAFAGMTEETDPFSPFAGMTKPIAVTPAKAGV